MKRKQWLKFLIYLIILIVLVILRVYAAKLTREFYYKYFSMPFIPLIVTILTNIALGLLLGFEHMLQEKQSGGTWKINFPKLVLLGLPMLYCSIANFSMYSPNKILLYLFTYPMWWLINYDANILSVFQLIFGYVVITSFYKYKKFGTDRY